MQTAPYGIPPPLPEQHEAASERNEPELHEAASEKNDPELHEAASEQNEPEEGKKSEEDTPQYNYEPKESLIKRRTTIGQAIPAHGGGEDESEVFDDSHFSKESEGNLPNRA